MFSISQFKPYAYKSETTHNEPEYDEKANEYIIVETVTHHIEPIQLKRLQQDAEAEKLELENYDPAPEIQEKAKIIQDINFVLKK